MFERSKKKARGKKRASRRASKVGWLVKRALFALLFLLIGAVGGLAAVFYYYSLDLPTIGPLLQGYEPPQTTRILAADGTVIGELFTERRTVVPLGRIPEVMIDATIAAEDADFRKHEGLDYPGMIRAMLTNIASGKLSQGASTITQQVARTFFLTRQKKFSRKIREILLTKHIEERLTKEEILYLYLNQINFGHARYGVLEAARFYFGKRIEEIGLTEAALLAGIPKGPSIYSPIVNPEAAKKRRAYVLGEMAKLRMISAQQMEAAASAPLGVIQVEPIQADLAPEAVSRAIDEVSDVIEPSKLKSGGYVIQTTLDPDLQRFARQAVLSGLTEIDKRHKRLAPFDTRNRWPDGNRGLDGKLSEGQTYVAEVVGHSASKGLIGARIGKRLGWIDFRAAARYNPKGLKIEDFAPTGAKLHVSLAQQPRQDGDLKLNLEIGPQAALVALNPHTGSIAALIGADAARPGGFNRATAAKRQPGSAFKPFVYLTAIRSGRYTPASLLDDAPEVQGEWQPQNTESGTYEGTVRLRRAIAHSINMPAIKLITDIGPENVAELGGKLGITSTLDPTPSLALGASAVTPLELAAAYSVLPAQGKLINPWIVERITGQDGVDVPLVGRAPQQVITEQEAYLATSLLESVVQEGTGSRARSLGRPAAGKTGTSNSQRDAWFAGFTPDWVCVVWVGYDDYRPIGNKEYGGRAALPIWLDFMEHAQAKLPKRDFAVPDGIVTAKIDPASGKLAYDGMEGAIEEIFIEGTEPTETATPPELVSPSSFLLDQAVVDAGPDAHADGE